MPPRRNSQHPTLENSTLESTLISLQAALEHLRLSNDQLSTQLLSQQTEIQLLHSSNNQLHQQLSSVQSQQQHPQQQTILIRDPIRINPPQEFHGKRKEVSSFLAQCGIVFKADQSHFQNDENKLNTAISYLRGDAFKWYEAIVRVHGPFLEYSKFSESLKATFGNYTEVSPDKAMHDLIKCRQTASVQSYVTAFQLKASRLPTTTNDHTKMFHFKDGLKKQIHDFINNLRPQPTSLSELMKTATEYDDNIHSSLSLSTSDSYSSSHSSDNHSSSTNNHAHIPTYSSSHHNEDIEMTEVHSTNVKPTNVKPFQKLTPEEKLRRKDAHLCIYCGEHSCPGSKDVNKCSKLIKNQQSGKAPRQKN